MITILSQTALTEEKTTRRVDRLMGKKVSILGMARSGIACAKLLKRNGASVFVSDLKNEHQLQKEVSELKNLKIDYETGGHTSRVFENKDFIVTSPGIPPDIPVLKQAQQKGIPAFSEIEVSSWLCQAPIIAITGSNGKTTTTSLVGEILKEVGWEYQVAGNIGLAFSNVVDKVSPRGFIVLEVSSFQLEKIEEFNPHIAAILNISPDHLDRYPDMNSYIQAKIRILENQTSRDFAILNFDDRLVAELKEKTRAKVVLFSTGAESKTGVYVKAGKIYALTSKGQEEIISAKEIGIPGPHNLSNSCCAISIATALGVPVPPIRKALKEFKGVEHRLEKVATVKGVHFINDSKATNVESVWYALQSVSGKIVLIAGGKDKGGDFTKLKELVSQKVKALILIGQAQKKINDSLGSYTKTLKAKTLQQAVELAFRNSVPGDTVLLAPGCASFDMFTDYEHRGRVFKEKVAEIQKREGKL